MVKPPPTPPKLKRNSPIHKPLIKLVVVCEGKNTEPHYIKAFAADHGFSGNDYDLQCVTAGVPCSLVDQALREGDALHKALRSLRKNSGRRFVPKVWVVCDVDEHPPIDAVRRNRAASNDISLAISNPCIELWALYHFRDQDAPIDRHMAAKNLQAKMSGYHPKKSKKFDYSLMKENYAAARQRAATGRVNRMREGAVDGNPSTSLDKLLDWIMEQVPTMAN